MDFVVVLLQNSDMIRCRVSNTADECVCVTGWVLCMCVKEKGQVFFAFVWVCVLVVYQVRQKTSLHREREKRAKETRETLRAPQLDL